MRYSPWCVAGLLIFGTVAIAASNDDPLTAFLISKGFSNVPYTDQLRAAPGGYVVYDTEHNHAPPLWEGPVEGEQPVIMQTPDEIHIPKTTVSKLRGLNIDIKLFGINPMLKLQSSGTMEYSEMILKPSALADANAVYKLLAVGAPLDKEFLEYGKDNNPQVWANQHLYPILTVYYSTGISITSTKAIQFGASTTDKIADCPKAPALPGDPQANADAPKPGGAAAPKADGGAAQGAGAAPAAQKVPDSLKGVAEAAAKAAAIAVGQAAGGSAGQAVSGSGGLAAAKSTASATATAAVKAASGALPGGGGSYCMIDSTHVEWHSAQPIPVAAQLLRALPLGDNKWNLIGSIVEFDGRNTKEKSN